MTRQSVREATRRAAGELARGASCGRTRGVSACLTVALLAAFAACSRSTPTAVSTTNEVGSASSAPGSAASADARFEPVASVQELMDSEVDPSADAVWDSVVTTVTLKGEEDKRPRTAEDWKAVRLHALVLVEATNLLAITGRRAAPVNAPPPAAGELPASRIQQLIDANPEGFVQFARVLRAAALQALQAIDAKDADKLMDAGGTIDQACEACHVTFWYPNQVVPKG